MRLSSFSLLNTLFTNTNTSVWKLLNDGDPGIYAMSETAKDPDEEDEVDTEVISDPKFTKSSSQHEIQNIFVKETCH